MSIGIGRAVLAVLVTGCGLAATGMAQPGRVYTTADYAEAEKFMDYNLRDLTMHTVDHPTWLPDGRFWYSDTGADGTAYLLVDPAKGTKVPAFDQVKLAAALNASTAAAPAPPAGDAPAGRGRRGGGGGGAVAAPQKADPNHLVITDLAFENGDKTVVVTTGGRQMRCDLSGTGTCSPTGVAGGGGGRGGRGGRGGAGGVTAPSPDGKKAAFIRDGNLWVRDIPGNQEVQLTTDGEKGYGYATDNAGWAQSDRPVVVWSPDSKKIATFQQDERKVKDMYLVPTVVGHPTLNTVKYPLAGDSGVAMVERVIIDVDAKKVVRLKMAADYHRSTTCDNLACRGWDDVEWSDDSKHLAFISTSRDHRQEWLRVADPDTGDVRDVMTETVKTFFEAGAGKANWKYMPATNEFIWFSERDNWGQLYLYDLTTGKVKNQITKGDGNVTQIVKIDEKARVVYFMGLGKQKAWDPYFPAFYRVNFDGSGMKLLTPDEGVHTVVLSPDGKYFSDIYSSITKPAMGDIRDSATGKVAVALPSEDISKLKAIGWVPPVPITVKARDGKTDLYGFMFKPTTLDPAKKYPIVNHVYPGPQTGSCGGRGFAAAHGDMQSLAELGFIVVCIDGMGTPGRSKAFHEALFGDMGDNTIPDQVAGMKELAAKYPWIDIDKAGIYGHSGGGAATGAAMFHFPDFFKVGISESGNHDNRVYEDDWGEKWLGVETKDANGKSNYDSQANEDFAKNLKGHLLLAHGTMDNNVPPNNTMLVVEALIKANKDFDLLMIPNVAHGYGPYTNYMTRRRWDYFVRYLGDGIPPHEYQMKPAAAPGPPAS
jgi:Tol biopolymer transport system component/dienelactone hydrolase